MFAGFKNISSKFRETIKGAKFTHIRKETIDPTRRMVSKQ